LPICCKPAKHLVYHHYALPICCKSAKHLVMVYWR